MTEGDNVCGDVSIAGSPKRALKLEVLVEFVPIQKTATYFYNPVLHSRSSSFSHPSFQNSIRTTTTHTLTHKCWDFTELMNRIRLKKIRLLQSFGKRWERSDVAQLQIPPTFLEIRHSGKCSSITSGGVQSPCSVQKLCSLSGVSTQTHL